MTTEEAIQTLQLARAEVEWEYPIDIAAALDMAIAALEQDRWISVEERLPNKYEEVLICTDEYGKSLMGFATTAIWEGNIWLEAWTKKETIWAVTHWRPLPEPPKEENNG